MSDFDLDDEQDFEWFWDLLIETYENSPTAQKQKNIISADWWRQWCDFNNIAVQKPNEIINEIVNEVKFWSIELPKVEESFNIDLGAMEN